MDSRCWSQPVPPLAGLVAVAELAAVAAAAAGSFAVAVVEEFASAVHSAATSVASDRPVHRRIDCRC